MQLDQMFPGQEGAEFIAIITAGHLHNSDPKL